MLGLCKVLVYTKHNTLKKGFSTMDLQNAFYIIGIVYMGISLLLILGVVVALFVIRAKVVSLENMVKEKIAAVTSLPAQVAEIVGSVKKMTSKSK